MTELIEERLKSVIEAIDEGIVVQADAQFLLQMLRANAQNFERLNCKVAALTERVNSLRGALAEYKHTSIPDDCFVARDALLADDEKAGNV